MPLEAVDLFFADRDGKRPSLWRVVRDSIDKDFVAGIEKQLQERAALRAEKQENALSSEHKAGRLELEAV